MKLDPQAALTGKSLLLLDFDGPVCSVFAGYPARQIAAELLEVLRRFAPHLADALSEERDPMEVLRQSAGTLPQDQVDKIDEQLGRAELTAVESAEPTPGAADLIVTTRRSGLKVAIVSNNSAEPITKYLRSHGLDSEVDLIIGRPFGRPGQMKPEPYLLHEALRALSIDAAHSCFVGDSVTDIQAGQAAEVMTIGYANKPGKTQRLGDAGADIVVTAL